MNSIFILITIAMILIAIALLVYPLLKKPKINQLAYEQSNLSINATKINDLELDLKEGRISQDLYKSAREELDRELLEDIPQNDNKDAEINLSTKKPIIYITLISLFVPLVAIFIYYEIGNYQANDPAFLASQKHQPKAQAPSLEVMAKRLQQKIEKEGGSVEEWSMLARAHKLSAQYAQAEKAFVVALEKDSNNPDLMIELAEVITLQNNRTFTQPSIDLIEKAYTIAPTNPNVLWFMGVQKFQQKDYQHTIKLLRQLLPALKNDIEISAVVVEVITKSRRKLIEAGEKMPALATLLGVDNDVKAQAAIEPPVTAKNTNISTRLLVHVDINDEIKQKFSGQDTIFIYAKAKQGPPMPLAAKRITLSQLPTTITLDDSMAMMPKMNLSAFKQVIVSARVSKSGGAMAKSGDYIGHVETKTNQKDIKLKIQINTLVE